MKNPEIAKVFEEIENGTIGIEEANERLKAAGAPYHLSPWKNVIGRNEDGYGLLYTGTGTPDKVKVINGELEFDVNQVNPDGTTNMYATVEYDGNKYEVKGRKLVEIQ